MALPAVPSMLGGNDEAKNEYFAALQKTLDALEARSKPDINWLQVAGQFLDPGRTGSFGEALGRAAVNIGQQREKQREAELPIAQMRAQISGQKYEIENQSKALGLLSSTLGVEPNQVQNTLSSGVLPPQTAAKLAQVYPVIAQLSPKVGEIVKGSFTMQKDLSTMATDDRKAGMSQAELVAKYGPGVLGLIPGGGIPTGNEASVSAPLPEAPAPVPAAAAAPVPVPPSPTAPISPAASTLPPAPNAAADRTARDITSLKYELSRLPPSDPRRTIIQAELNKLQPAASAPPSQQQSDLAGLPLAAQADVSQKRVEASDKPFVQKRDEILNFTPQTLEASNTNLRQLDYFAAKHPRIFGMMQQQGVLSGILTAAQEGAQLSAGDFNAKLGLPVKSFLEKVKLPPQEQQAVRDVTRILGSEFLSNVRANKGLLGVNPTDNDARLLQAPMASTDDSARAVQLWSRQQLLLNKQRADLYKAYSAHADTAGPASSPRTFFRPGSVYDKINSDYAKLREQLFTQFNP